MTESTISQKASFDFIRYGSVWEDADILCAALAPAAKGGRILSIASSGDNVLAMLTLDPKEIIAADLNSSQLACVELRVAAFRNLDHAALLEFLGVSPSNDRMQVYQKLRKELSPSAAAFWDSHSDDINNGIIHAGKFERYLKAFGKWIIPIIHSKQKRMEILKNQPLQVQAEFYNKKWDTWLWRLFFRVFFSRLVMGKMGRDPAFFDHVEGNVSERIMERTRHALTQLPAFNNPYLVYILTGNYRTDALPRYLRQGYKDTITKRLNRIKLFQGPIQKANNGNFDAFNLSDIYEYMNAEEYQDCYEQLLERANKGGRFAYWNMLVPRSAPSTLKHRLRHNDQISKTLHFQDKAWFYQAFVVDEVIG